MANAQTSEPAQAVGQPGPARCSPPAGARRALRPLRVVLLNGAAQKCDGDLRIARLLGNSALQVELTILRDQHAAERDISPHLLHFYRTIAEVQARTYDALVVAGHHHQDQRCTVAGREDELAEVIAWSGRQGHAGLVLGAAAYAVLGLCYGLGARRLPARRRGVVRHQLVAQDEPLLRGHDRWVWVPVVDGLGLEHGDLPTDGALASLVESELAGIHVLRDEARRLTLVLNDISADPEAIAARLGEGSGVHAPCPGGGAARRDRSWRSHAQLLFANWLAVEAGRSPAATRLPREHEVAAHHQVAPA